MSINSIARYWAWTLNNYSEEDVNKIKTWAKNNPNLGHIIFGYEEAPTTGTKHLQGGLAFKSGKKTKGTAIINQIGVHLNNLLPCRKHYNATVNYCSKENKDGSEKIVWQWPDNFINIKKDLYGKKEKKQTKTEVFELAKQGKFTEIDGSYWLTYEKQIKRIYTDNLPVDKMFFDQGEKNYFKTFNCLLYGKTGTGKTYRLEMIVKAINTWWESYCITRKMEYMPLTVYRKQQNKWWDDYLGQKIIIIEELEPNWVQMAQSNLKTWIDSEPFPAETKGGHIQAIRPWFFLLTSNYDLEDLCGFGKTDYNPKVLYEPLSRRINCIKVNNFDQAVIFPNIGMLCDYFWSIADVKKNYELKCKNYYNELLKISDKPTITASEPDRENQINEPILIPSDDEQATTSDARQESKEEKYIYCCELPGYENQLEPPKAIKRKRQN